MNTKILRRGLVAAGLSLAVLASTNVAIADTYAPDPVSALAAARRTGIARGIRLTWTPPTNAVTNNLTSYKIEYLCTGTKAPCTGSYILVTNLAAPSNKTAPVIYDLVAPAGTGNKDVTYRVTPKGVTESVTYEGTPSTGTVKVGDKPIVIALPLTLTSTVAKKVKVVIKSTALTSANGSSVTGYVVQYSTSATGTFTTVTAPSGGWGLNKSATVTVPKSKTSYYFRLTVNSTAGATVSTAQKIVSK